MTSKHVARRSRGLRLVAAACLAAATPLGAWSAEPAGDAAAIDGVRIQRFEIVGASAVAEAELQAVLAPWLHTPLSREALGQAARAVERSYQAQHRRVARVTLPPQDVTDGVVRLQVAEARYGKTVVQAAEPVAAIDVDRAQALVRAQQREHELLDIDAVERATALLNEWPGLSAQSSLVAGSQSGETDLAVSLQDRRPWDVLLRADNEGARATGAARLGFDASFVVPGGGGQTIGLGGSISEGSRQIRLSASAPLNDDGWRASLYGSALDYRLVTEEFNALDVKGPSDTLGVSLAWAARRRSDSSADASAQLEHRRFDNQALGTTLAKYTIDVLTLRWAVQAGDATGRTSGELGASAGRVDLGGSPNETADALTTRTAGRYALLRGSLTRLQPVSATQSWSLRANGQFSSHNLDVSERLPIAGPAGVRAYPVGEATGSRGFVASAEGLQSLAGWGRADVTVAAFADVGLVHQLIDNDFPGANPVNRLRLGGAGLWLEWRPSSAALALRLTAARPIGAHPNPTPLGTNQDGSRIGTRWWASLQWAL